MAAQGRAWAPAERVLWADRAPPACWWSSVTRPRTDRPRPRSRVVEGADERGNEQHAGSSTDAALLPLPIIRALKIPLAALLAVACASPEGAEIPNQPESPRPDRNRTVYHLENVDATAVALSLTELFTDSVDKDGPIARVDADPETNTLLIWMRDAAQLPELVALITHMDRPRSKE